MEIKELEIKELEDFAPIFDSYRQRYKQPSELEKVKQYLLKMLETASSKILLSYENEHITGFIQLYPSFSSIGLAPIWILNDFYIFSGSQKKLTATMLMDEAKKLCQATNAIRVEVNTRKENHKLHKLYKEYGFEKDYKYDYYFLRVNKQTAASEMLK